MWRTISVVSILINLVLCLLINAKIPSTLNTSTLYSLPTIDITAPKGNITAEIPKNDAEYMLGLGNRARLAADRGMLFRFPNAGSQPMWMKGMRFPLDILWLDKNKKVIYLKENIAPNTYQNAEAVLYFSPEPNAQYVLELPAGNAARLGITVGTHLAF